MMNNRAIRSWILASVGVLATALPLCAQDPPADAQPQLRLETGGPTSYVTALAFDPDGETIYAAGYDKVVMVWRLDRPTGKFVLDEAATFRIPIGPGLRGAINALAVSPDGNWLAVGGQGVIRGGAGFRDPGLVLPTLGGMTDTMRLDEGTIYLFHTATRAVHRLRGHMGPVLSLAFAPDAAAQPVLISAGQEWDAKADKFIGTLRGWDVTGRKYLGGITLAEPKTRPGLAVLRTGTALNAVRVGFAWQQGSFGVWDVARGAGATQLPDGQNNHAVVILSQDNGFVTGSSRGGSGVLQRWNQRPGQMPSKGQELLLSPRGEVHCVPDALAAISSQPGGKTDQVAAAVLLAEPRAVGGANKLVPTRFELQIVTGDLRRTLSRTPLWESDVPPRMPVVASAPGGKYVAVAGGGDHEIHVFPIAGLLAGQAAPQILRGLGTSTGQASFVRQGDRWGLLLADGRKSAAGAAATEPKTRDAVFDFANKKFETLAAGHAWRPATVAAKGWQLSLVAPQAAAGAARSDERAAVIVRGPNGNERRVELPKGHGVTDFAILPPADGRIAPILAVAMHDRGQPLLGLYHAGTGEQIRQFTGHTQRIRSVAFADDGRLLVTAGDDQTVCVWSLTDLGQTLDVHGVVPGIAVKDEQGAIVVAQVADDSAARGQLNVGDRIAGRVVEGKLRPWTSAREFYDAVWDAKPNSPFAVRRQRGAAASDVSLRVAQGIDERKPLFSFFVTRGGNLAERQWIGWSPIGPYDSSDRRIEKYLGWHFNTGLDGGALDFARAAQYRERYYRDGLLAELVAAGDLPPAPAVAVLARPEIKLSLRDPASDEFSSLSVVRHPAVVLDIGIDPDFPREKFARLELLLDDKSIAQVEPDTNTWQHDLSKLKLTRGEHKLVVVLQTSESVPQEFREELAFRYQPLPPVIKVALPTARSQVVKEKEARVRATISPAVAGEALQVALVRVGGEKPEVIRKWDGAEPIEIDQVVNLAAGQNVIDVVARNRGAAEETATERFVMTLDPGAVAPPQIVLSRIEPVADGAEEQGLRIVPGNRVLVSSADVRLAGTISADEPLTSAAWRKADDKQSQPLGGFESKKAKSFAIRQPITLAAGVQKVRIEAQADGSKSAQSEVEIEYRPALPEVEIVSPASGQVYSGYEATRQTALQAVLRPTEKQQPFEVAVTLNGKVVASKIDDATGTITANLPLVAGENRIQLKLTNAWQAEHATEPIVVVYRPTPKVGEIAAPQKVERPFVTVEGTLDSVTKPEIEVGGQPVAADDIRFDEEMKQWRFKARDVPVVSDSKKIVVRSRNKYGEAPAATIVAPEIMAPPPPLASVEILAPRTDSTTTSDEATIRFSVRSDTPLKEIELLHDGRKVYDSPNAAKLDKDDDGYYQTIETAAIALHAGQNDLVVRAVNEGGRQSATVAVSYEPLPVRLVIDGISPVDQPQKIINTVVAKSGRIRFAGPAPQGKVLLRGRVVWANAGDKLLAKKQQVQVWVNGFQQLPTALKSPAEGALERSFSTTVVLNRSEDNLIEVGLPSLVHEASSRLACVADCEKPIRDQRLHLLIVGIGVDDTGKEALRKEALAALEARTAANNVAGSAVEPLRVRRKIYGPLIGPHLTRGKVVTQLCNIKSNIENLAKVEPSSDVVVIYYQGGELIFADGRFFLTTSQALRGEQERNEREASQLKHYALDSDLLTQFVSDTRGAHVLLLDVARIPEQGIAKNLWPSESRLAMLRYAWASREERPAAPGDAMLISDLRRVVPKAGMLKQLEEELGKNFTVTDNGRISKQYQDALRFESYVPESLHRLELGTP